MRSEENKPLIVLVVLTLLSALLVVLIALTVDDIITTCLLAYSLGIVMCIAYSVVLRPIIAKMNLFFFLHNAMGCSIHGAGFYFFTDTAEQYPDGPHFSPKFYVSGIGATAAFFSIAGLCGYNKWARHWPYRRVLLIGNIANSCLGLLSAVVFTRFNKKIGISDTFFMVASTGLQNAVFQFSWLPGMLLLSQLCPGGLESTMFALLAGCSNLASGMAHYLGAFVLYKLGVRPKGQKDEGAVFENLWIAAVLSAILPLIPMIFLPYLIPDARQTDKLLIDHPESATFGSIYEKNCARRNPNRRPSAAPYSPVVVGASSTRQRRSGSSSSGSVSASASAAATIAAGPVVEAGGGVVG